jgi:hypothetical protein
MTWEKAPRRRLMYCISRRSQAPAQSWDYGISLVPGGASTFKHVYVGRWLLEIADAPAHDGACENESKGWIYEGQTHHTEILCSTSYSKNGWVPSDGTGVLASDIA